MHLRLLSSIFIIAAFSHVSVTGSGQLPLSSNKIFSQLGGLIPKFSHSQNVFQNGMSSPFLLTPNLGGRYTATSFGTSSPNPGLLMFLAGNPLMASYDSNQALTLIENSQLSSGGEPCQTTLDKIKEVAGIGMNQIAATTEEIFARISRIIDGMSGLEINPFFLPGPISIAKIIYSPLYFFCTGNMPGSSTQTTDVSIPTLSSVIFTMNGYLFWNPIIGWNNEPAQLPSVDAMPQPDPSSPKSIFSFLDIPYFRRFNPNSLGTFMNPFSMNPWQNYGTPQFDWNFIFGTPNSPDLILEVADDFPSIDVPQNLALYFNNTQIPEEFIIFCKYYVKIIQTVKLTPYTIKVPPALYFFFPNANVPAEILQFVFELTTNAMDQDDLPIPPEVAIYFPDGTIPDKFIAYIIQIMSSDQPVDFKIVLVELVEFFTDGVIPEQIINLVQNIIFVFSGPDRLTPEDIEEGDYPPGKNVEDIILPDEVDQSIPDESTKQDFYIFLIGLVPNLEKPGRMPIEMQIYYQLSVVFHGAVPDPVLHFVKHLVITWGKPVPTFDVSFPPDMDPNDIKLPNTIRIYFNTPDDEERFRQQLILFTEELDKPLVNRYRITIPFDFKTIFGDTMPQEIKKFLKFFIIYWHKPSRTSETIQIPEELTAELDNPGDKRTITLILIRILKQVENPEVDRTSIISQIDEIFGQFFLKQPNIPDDFLNYLRKIILTWHKPTTGDEEPTDEENTELAPQTGEEPEDDETSEFPVETEDPEKVDIPDELVEELDEPTDKEMIKTILIQILQQIEDPLVDRQDVVDQIRTIFAQFFITKPEIPDNFVNYIKKIILTWHKPTTGNEEPTDEENTELAPQTGEEPEDDETSEFPVETEDPEKVDIPDELVEELDDPSDKEIIKTILIQILQQIEDPLVDRQDVVDQIRTIFAQFFIKKPEIPDNFVNYIKKIILTWHKPTTGNEEPTDEENTELAPQTGEEPEDDETSEFPVETEDPEKVDIPDELVEELDDPSDKEIIKTILIQILQQIEDPLVDRQDVVDQIRTIFAQFFIKKPEIPDNFVNYIKKIILTWHKPTTGNEEPTDEENTELAPQTGEEPEDDETSEFPVETEDPEKVDIPDELVEELDDPSDKEIIKTILIQILQQIEDPLVDRQDVVDQIRTIFAQFFIKKPEIPDNFVNYIKKIILTWHKPTTGNEEPTDEENTELAPQTGEEPEDDETSEFPVETEDPEKVDIPDELVEELDDPSDKEIIKTILIQILQQIEDPLVDRQDVVDQIRTIFAQFFIKKPEIPDNFVNYIKKIILTWHKPTTGNEEPTDEENTELAPQTGEEPEDDETSEFPVETEDPEKVDIPDELVEELDDPSDKEIIKTILIQILQQIEDPLVDRQDVVDQIRTIFAQFFIKKPEIPDNFVNYIKKIILTWHKPTTGNEEPTDEENTELAPQTGEEPEDDETSEFPVETEDPEKVDIPDELVEELDDPSDKEIIKTILIQILQQIEDPLVDRQDVVDQIRTIFAQFFIKKPEIPDNFVNYIKKIILTWHKPTTGNEEPTDEENTELAPQTGEEPEDDETSEFPVETEDPEKVDIPDELVEELDDPSDKEIIKTILIQILQQIEDPLVDRQDVVDQIRTIFAQFFIKKPEIPDNFVNYIKKIILTWHKPTTGNEEPTDEENTELAPQTGEEPEDDETSEFPVETEDPEKVDIPDELVEELDDPSDKEIIKTILIQILQQIEDPLVDRQDVVDQIRTIFAQFFIKKPEIPDNFVNYIKKIILTWHKPTTGNEEPTDEENTELAPQTGEEPEDDETSEFPVETEDPEKVDIPDELVEELDDPSDKEMIKTILIQILQQIEDPLVDRQDVVDQIRTIFAQFFIKKPEIPDNFVNYIKKIILSWHKPTTGNEEPTDEENTELAPQTEEEPTDEENTELVPQTGEEPTDEENTELAPQTGEEPEDTEISEFPVETEDPEKVDIPEELVEELDEPTDKEMIKVILIQILQQIEDPLVDREDVVDQIRTIFAQFFIKKPEIPENFVNYIKKIILSWHKPTTGNEEPTDEENTELAPQTGEEPEDSEISEFPVETEDPEKVDIPEELVEELDEPTDKEMIKVILIQILQQIEDPLVDREDVVDQIRTIFAQFFIKKPEIPDNFVNYIKKIILTWHKPTTGNEEPTDEENTELAPQTEEEPTDEENTELAPQTGEEPTDEENTELAPQTGEEPEDTEISEFPVETEDPEKVDIPEELVEELDEPTDKEMIKVILIQILQQIEDPLVDREDVVDQIRTIFAQFFIKKPEIPENFVNYIKKIILSWHKPTTGNEEPTDEENTELAPQTEEEPTDEENTELVPQTGEEPTDEENTELAPQTGEEPEDNEISEFPVETEDPEKVDIPEELVEELDEPNDKEIIKTILIQILQQIEDPLVDREDVVDQIRTIFAQFFIKKPEIPENFVNYIKKIILSWHKPTTGNEEPTDEENTELAPQTGEEPEDNEISEFPVETEDPEKVDIPEELVEELDEPNDKEIIKTILIQILQQIEDPLVDREDVVDQIRTIFAQFFIKKPEIPENFVNYIKKIILSWHKPTTGNEDPTDEENTELAPQTEEEPTDEENTELAPQTGEEPTDEENTELAPQTGEEPEDNEISEFPVETEDPEKVDIPEELVEELDEPNDKEIIKTILIQILQQIEDPLVDREDVVDQIRTIFAQFFIKKPEIPENFVNYIKKIILSWHKPTTGNEEPTDEENTELAPQTGEEPEDHEISEFPVETEDPEKVDIPEELVEELDEPNDKEIIKTILIQILQQIEDPLVDREDVVDQIRTIFAQFFIKKPEIPENFVNYIKKIILSWHKPTTGNEDPTDEENTELAPQTEEEPTDEENTELAPQTGEEPEDTEISEFPVETEDPEKVDIPEELIEELDEPTDKEMIKVILIQILQQIEDPLVDREDVVDQIRTIFAQFFIKKPEIPENFVNYIKKIILSWHKPTTGNEDPTDEENTELAPQTEEEPTDEENTELAPQTGEEPTDEENTELAPQTGEEPEDNEISEFPVETEDPEKVDIPEELVEELDEPTDKEMIKVILIQILQQIEDPLVDREDVVDQIRTIFAQFFIKKPEIPDNFVNYIKKIILTWHKPTTGNEDPTDQENTELAPQTEEEPEDNGISEFPVETEDPEKVDIPEELVEELDEPTDKEMIKVILIQILQQIEDPLVDREDVVDQIRTIFAQFFIKKPEIPDNFVNYIKKIILTWHKPTTGNEEPTDEENTELAPQTEEQPTDEEGTEPISETGEEPTDEENTELAPQTGEEPTDEENTELAPQTEEQPTDEEGTEPISETGEEPTDEENTELAPQTGEEPEDNEISEFPVETEDPEKVDIPEELVEELDEPTDKEMIKVILIQILQQIEDPLVDREDVVDQIRTIFAQFFIKKPEIPDNFVNYIKKIILTWHKPTTGNEEPTDEENTELAPQTEEEPTDEEGTEPISETGQEPTDEENTELAPQTGEEPTDEENTELAPQTGEEPEDNEISEFPVETEDPEKVDIPEELVEELDEPTDKEMIKVILIQILQQIEDPLVDREDVVDQIRTIFAQFFIKKPEIPENFVNYIKKIILSWHKPTTGNEEPTDEENTEVAPQTGEEPEDHEISEFPVETEDPEKVDIPEELVEELDEPTDKEMIKVILIQILQQIEDPLVDREDVVDQIRTIFAQFFIKKPEIPDNFVNYIKKIILTWHKPTTGNEEPTDEENTELAPQTEEEPTDEEGTEPISETGQEPTDEENTELAPQTGEEPTDEENTELAPQTGEEPEDDEISEFPVETEDPEKVDIPEELVEELDEPTDKEMIKVILIQILQQIEDPLVDREDVVDQIRTIFAQFFIKKPEIPGNFVNYIKKIILTWHKPTTGNEEPTDEENTELAPQTDEEPEDDEISEFPVETEDPEKVDIPEELVEELDEPTDKEMIKVILIQILQQIEDPLVDREDVVDQIRTIFAQFFIKKPEIPDNFVNYIKKIILTWHKPTTGNEEPTDEENTELAPQTEEEPTDEEGTEPISETGQEPTDEENTELAPQTGEEPTDEENTELAPQTGEEPEDDEISEFPVETEDPEKVDIPEELVEELDEPTDKEMIKVILIQILQQIEDPLVDREDVVDQIRTIFAQFFIKKPEIPDNFVNYIKKIILTWHKPTTGNEEPTDEENTELAPQTDEEPEGDEISEFPVETEDPEKVDIPEELVEELDEPTDKEMIKVILIQILQQIEDPLVDREDVVDQIRTIFAQFFIKKPEIPDNFVNYIKKIILTWHKPTTGNEEPTDEENTELAPQTEEEPTDEEGTEPISETGQEPTDEENTELAPQTGEEPTDEENTELAPQTGEEPEDNEISEFPVETEDPEKVDIPEELVEELDEPTDKEMIKVILIQILQQIEDPLVDRQDVVDQIRTIFAQFFIKKPEIPENFVNYIKKIILTWHKPTTGNEEPTDEENTELAPQTEEERTDEEGTELAPQTGEEPTDEENTELAPQTGEEPEDTEISEFPVETEDPEKVDIPEELVEELDEPTDKEMIKVILIQILQQIEDPLVDRQDVVDQIRTIFAQFFIKKPEIPDNFVNYIKKIILTWHKPTTGNEEPTDEENTELAPQTDEEPEDDEISEFPVETEDPEKVDIPEELVEELDEPTDKEMIKVILIQILQQIEDPLVDRQDVVDQIRTIFAQFFIKKPEIPDNFVNYIKKIILTWHKPTTGNEEPTDEENTELAPQTEEEPTDEEGIEPISETGQEPTDEENTELAPQTGEEPTDEENTELAPQTGEEPEDNEISEFPVETEDPEKVDIPEELVEELDEPTDKEMIKVILIQILQQIEDPLVDREDVVDQIRTIFAQFFIKKPEIPENFVNYIKKIILSWHKPTTGNEEPTDEENTELAPQTGEEPEGEETSDFPVETEDPEKVEIPEELVEELDDPSDEETIKTILIQMLEQIEDPVVDRQDVVDQIRPIFAQFFIKKPEIPENFVKYIKKIILTWHKPTTGNEDPTDEENTELAPQTGEEPEDDETSEFPVETEDPEKVEIPDELVEQLDDPSDEETIKTILIQMLEQIEDPVVDRQNVVDQIRPIFAQFFIKKPEIPENFVKYIKKIILTWHKPTTGNEDPTDEENTELAPQTGEEPEDDETSEFPVETEDPEKVEIPNELVEELDDPSDEETIKTILIQMLEQIEDPLVDRQDVVDQIRPIFAQFFIKKPEIPENFVKYIKKIILTWHKPTTGNEDPTDEENTELAPQTGEEPEDDETSEFPVETEDPEKVEIPNELVEELDDPSDEETIKTILIQMLEQIEDPLVDRQDVVDQIRTIFAQFFIKKPEIPENFVKYIKKIILTWHKPTTGNEEPTDEENTELAPQTGEEPDDEETSEFPVETEDPEKVEIPNELVEELDDPSDEETVKTILIQMLEQIEDPLVDRQDVVDQIRTIFAQFFIKKPEIPENFVKYIKKIILTWHKPTTGNEEPTDEENTELAPQTGEEPDDEETSEFPVETEDPEKVEIPDELAEELDDPDEKDSVNVIIVQILKQIENPRVDRNSVVNQIRTIFAQFFVKQPKIPDNFVNFIKKIVLTWHKTDKTIDDNSELAPETGEESDYPVETEDPEKVDIPDELVKELDDPSDKETIKTILIQILEQIEDPLVDREDVVDQIRTIFAQFFIKKPEIPENFVKYIKKIILTWHKSQSSPGDESGTEEPEPVLEVPDELSQYFKDDHIPAQFYIFLQSLIPTLTDPENIPAITIPDDVMMCMKNEEPSEEILEFLQNFVITWSTPRGQKPADYVVSITVPPELGIYFDGGRVPKEFLEFLRDISPSGRTPATIDPDGGVELPPMIFDFFPEGIPDEILIFLQSCMEKWEKETSMNTVQLEDVPGVPTVPIPGDLAQYFPGGKIPYSFQIILKNLGPGGAYPVEIDSDNSFTIPEDIMRSISNIFKGPIPQQIIIYLQEYVTELLQNQAGPSSSQSISIPGDVLGLFSDQESVDDFVMYIQNLLMKKQWSLNSDGTVKLPPGLEKMFPTKIPSRIIIYLTRLVKGEPDEVEYTPGTATIDFPPELGKYFVGGVIPERFIKFILSLGPNGSNELKPKKDGSFSIPSGIMKFFSDGNLPAEITSFITRCIKVWFLQPKPSSQENKIFSISIPPSLLKFFPSQQIPPEFVTYLQELTPGGKNPATITPDGSLQLPTGLEKFFKGSIPPPVIDFITSIAFKSTIIPPGYINPASEIDMGEIVIPSSFKNYFPEGKIPNEFYTFIQQLTSSGSNPATINPDGSVELPSELEKFFVSGVPEEVESFLVNLVVSWNEKENFFPLDPDTGHPVDPNLGFHIDPNTGLPVNPNLGFPIDPKLGFPIDPNLGFPIDPKLGFPEDPDTELPVNPDAELPVDPDTELPVDPDTELPVDPDTELPVDPETGLPIGPNTGLPVDPDTGLPTGSDTGLPIDPDTGLPIDPDTGLPIDPETGLPVDPDTGLPIDPDTGLPVDPDTGLPIDPDTGLPVDPDTGSPTGSNTGLPVDPDTGLPIDPDTGSPIDPETGLPVDPDTGLPIDPKTGLPVDPDTELPVDPDTGLPIDPDTGLPIDPDTGLPIDPDTGLPIDPETGLPIDPDTGSPIDPETGLPVGPDTGLPIDPETGLPVDPDTELPVDPETGLPIDPDTGLPIDPETGLPIDPNTGLPTDPNTGLPVNPGTGSGPPTDGSEPPNMSQDNSNANPPSTEEPDYTDPDYEDPNNTNPSTPEQGSQSPNGNLHDDGSKTPPEVSEEDESNEDSYEDEPDDNNGSGSGNPSGNNNGGNPTPSTGGGLTPDKGGNGGGLTPDKGGNGGGLTPDKGGNGGGLTPDKGGNGGGYTPDKNGNGGGFTPDKNGNGGGYTPDTNGNGGGYTPDKNGNGGGYTPDKNGNGGGYTPDKNGNGGGYTPDKNGNGGGYTPDKNGNGGGYTVDKNGNGGGYTVDKNGNGGGYTVDKNGNGAHLEVGKGGGSGSGLNIGIGGGGGSQYEVQKGGGGGSQYEVQKGGGGGSQYEVQKGGGGGVQYEVQKGGGGASSYTVSKGGGEASAWTKKVKLNKKQTDKIPTKMNKIRTEIATGLFADGSLTAMPPATNMKTLVWDTKLVKSAAKQAERCTPPFIKQTTVGETIYTYPNVSEDMKPPNLMADAVDRWADELRNNPWNNSTDINLIANGLQLAWAKSDKVGCAGHLCDSGKILNVVCHYNNRPNPLLATTYLTEGKPCAEYDKKKLNKKIGLCE